MVACSHNFTLQYLIQRVTESTSLADMTAQVNRRVGLKLPPRRFVVSVCLTSLFLFSKLADYDYKHCMLIKIVGFKLTSTEPRLALNIKEASNDTDTSSTACRP